MTLRHSKADIRSLDIRLRNSSSRAAREGDSSSIFMVDVQIQEMIYEPNFGIFWCSDHERERYEHEHPTDKRLSDPLFHCHVCRNITY